MRQVTPVGFICVVIGLMAWSIQDWSAPFKPPLLMLGMLIAFFAARYTWETFKSEREMGVKDLLPTPIEIGAVVLVLAMASSWMAPGVRAAAVKFASIQSRFNVEKALEDPSHKVKVAACVQLFEMGVTQSSNRVLTSMDEHPELADPCFKQAKAKGVTSTNILSEKLSQRWHHMIMTQALNQTPPVCDYIEPYELITNEHTTMPGKANLLACATSSISNKTRSCCAKHLEKRGNLAVYMGRARDFPMAIGGQIYPMLAALTFKHALLDEENKQIASSLTTQSEPTKRWVAELGCFLLSGEAESVDGIRGLVSFVEAGPCRPKDQEARLLFSKSETWGLTCDVMEQHSKEKPVEKGLCAGMERALVGLAVEEAKSRLKASARTWYLQAIAAASPETMGRYNGKNSWQARMKMWNALADGKLGFGELNRSDLWQAYGMNSKTDMALAGLLDNLPQVKEFLESDPELRRELEKFTNVDMNNDKQTERMLEHSFLLIGDVLQGKNLSNQRPTLKKYNDAKNVEQYNKGMDLAGETMKTLMSGNKSQSVGPKMRVNSKSAGSRSSGSKSSIQIQN